MKRKLLFLLIFLGIGAYVNGQYLSEGFEGGALPTDWSYIYESGTRDWAYQDGDNSSLSAHNGSYNAIFSGNYSDDATKLVTPEIDLSGATAPQLEFWHAQDDWGGDQDTLAVYYRTSPTDTWHYLGGWTNSISSWTKETFNLPSPSATYQIAFHGYEGYGYGVVLDDVVVQEAPSCPDPSAQTESNITSSSADLSWTENGSATTWEIMIDTAGFDTTGYAHTSTTNNPYNATGLSSNTSYDWYVRADCGGGSYSNWVGASTFTTECGIYTPEYTESFATYLPDCWSEATGYLGNPSVLTGTSSSWTQDDFANVSANGKSAKLNIYGTSKKEWLISPSIDLSGGTYQLEFDLALTHYANTSADTLGPDDTLAVVISTDNGTTWSINDTLEVWTYPEFISNTGEHITIDLSSYSSTVKIGFYGSSSVSNEDNDIFVDNFKVRTPPACPEPSAQTESNITSSSADLGWTENGSATTWDIELGTAGFTPSGTPTQSGVTANPYTYPGLASGTSYDWYVRADCGSGSYSNWVGASTFTTAQAPAPVQSLPFSEDWESGLSNSKWNWDAGSVSTIQTSTASAHNGTYGLEQYGNSSSSYSTPTDLSDAYTKAQPGGANENWTTWNKFSVDLSAASNPWLTFWYSMGYQYNDNYNNFWVQVSTDGTTWTDLFSTQTNGSTIAYEKKQFDLSAYNGTAQLYIRFFHNGKYNTNYLYLDDISVVEVSCPDPSAQTESNITASSADLGWTENGSATTWQIEWDTANFVQGTGTTVTVNTNPTYTLTGLTDSTDYDWYVRADCGSGSYSNWVGASTFTTEVTPNTVSAFPYNESFETDFGQWKQMSADDFDWTRRTGSTPSGSTGPSSAYSGSYYIYTEATGNNPDKTAGLLLAFDFSSLTTPQLTFAYHMYGSDMGTLQFEASTDNGSTWDTIWTKSGDQGNQWNNATVMLSTYGGNSNVYIKIWGVTGSDYTSDMAVDTIDIREAPACPDPSDQTETSITSTSANLGWTENGSATSWEIMIDTNGFDTTGYTHTLTSSNPYPKTGLTQSTQYDWYVRAICGAGDTSDWVGAHSFYTEPGNDDCSNAVSLTVGYDTTFVEGSNVGATESNNNPDPIPAPGCGSYNGGDVWYTATVPSTGYLRIVTQTVTGSSLTDGAMAYYTGTCGSLTLGDCNDDGGPGTMPELVINDASLANQTIYIRFWEYGNNSFGKFDIGATTYPATATWDGSTDGNWNDKTNWDVNAVPGTFTDVTIPPGLTNYPTLTSAAECNNLTIQSTSAGDGSLIGVNHLTVNGTATVQRYLTGGEWHDVSAMVNGAKVKSFFFNHSPDVWMNTYNESDNSRTAITDTATAMALGTGFEAWVENGNNATATFTGTINSGDVTPTLSYTDASHGYNLVGNPFSSAIQWGTGTWNLTNVNDQVWVWDAGWKDYVAGTSSGTLTNGIIPMGQGFFVRTNAAGPSMTIPADAQVHSSQAFYKTETVLPHLILSAVRDNKEDQLWILFHEGSTTAYENGFDGIKMVADDETAAPQIYAVEESEEFSIDCLPPVGEDGKTIPVYFKANQNGEQTIEAKELDLVPDLTVILEDTKLNVLQNLNKKPVYKFNAVTYQNPARFLLHLNRSANGIGENEAQNVRTFAYDGYLYIQSSGNDVTAKKQLMVYDMLGRKLIDKQVPPGDLIKVPLNLTDNYVIVKIISGGKVYSGKVFIQ